MSRFQISKEYIDQRSLSNQSISEFVSHTKEMWKKDICNYVFDTIVEMRQFGESYRVIAFSDDYTIVVVTQCNPETFFCVGYPFPIFEQKMSQDYTFPYTSVKVCVHGMCLRNAQKSYFLDKLSQKLTVKHRYVDGEETFRGLFQKTMRRVGKELWYFDSYRFIGDSILNTYMMDSLCNTYHLSPVFVSRNSEHLKALYPRTVNIRDNMAERLSGQIYAFADLLDNDSGWIYEYILRELLSGLYLFPGKNFFFSIEDRKVNVTSLTRRDVFLDDKNVFDYMNCCVQPFAEISEPYYETKKLLSNNTAVYLNFSTSLEAKSLTEKELQGIINVCRNFDINIWMSAGYNEVTKNIALRIKQINPRIQLVQTKSLEDVSLLLRSGNIGMVISPDSAICHLAVKLKIPTIIIYRLQYWDSRSLLSLSTESPLGFCGPDPCYLPLLFSQYTEERMLAAVNQLLDFFITGSKEILNNSSIVGFESLLSAFSSEEGGRLRSAAKKNDLKYKLEVFYK